jgi:hypothetical protein
MAGIEIQVGIHVQGLARNISCCPEKWLNGEWAVSDVASDARLTSGSIIRVSPQETAIPQAAMLWPP